MNKNSNWSGMEDTENKQIWTTNAIAEEIDFVENIAPKYGINAIINPKKETSKYAPDLFVDNIQIADLKKQTTPFFTANKYKYWNEDKEENEFEPGTTVTFNKKDYDRYKRLYPSIVIFFWVDWQRLKYSDSYITLSVEPLKGVWSVNLTEIIFWVEKCKIPLHEYKRRIDDKEGNARDSYLLALEWMTTHTKQDPM